MGRRRAFDEKLGEMAQRYHIIPQFSKHDAAIDRDIFQSEPMIATMCRMAGLMGSIALRPT
jgi:hypothetical protein